LPASLAALGVLKVPEFQAGSVAVLVPLLMVCAVPVAVLCLLIHQRLTAWYLLSDGVWIRSAILTLAIVFFASLVSWAAGLVTGKYAFVSWAGWTSLDAGSRWTPAVEAVLGAVVPLIGSSTLFLTAVKDVGGLPALPSAEFVKDLGLLRETLAKIERDGIWNDPQGRADAYDGIRGNAATAREVAGRLAQRSARLQGQHRFYEELSQDLEALEAARAQVALVSAKWSTFFDPEASIKTLNQADRNTREATLRLREVRFDA